MIEFIKKLFDTSDFPPRWECGTWESGHGWLHIISDILIFGAYVTIPIALIFFAWKKQREILFLRTVWLFAAFIMFCGIGHLIEATIFWQPWYRFSGVIKALTAIVSLLTVLALVKQMPIALKMPGLVTVNRELEETLKRKEIAQQELQQSNEELDQFAYVASHDLKAPLRSIKNLALWVSEDCEEILPEDSKGHLHQLQQRVDRLDNLLTDLLRYSRSGSAPAEAEEFEVAPLVRELFSDIAGTDREMKLEIASDLPKLHTLRVPFEQVMRNLLSNAVKHHHKDKGNIKVTGYEEDEIIYISVQDDGEGIPKEFQTKIFGMFQTLKTKDDVEGSGMGLAIVAKLIERMGGSVTVESETGEGATFTIAIPATFGEMEALRIYAP